MPAQPTRLTPVEPDPAEPRPVEPQLVTARLSDRPAVEIVIPVHNEEADVGPSVRRLHAFLLDGFPFSFQITIVDNASTDRTWALAEELATRLPGVGATRLPAKGRGRALRAAWSTSRATVVAYMDVDLSTDLGALLPLVAPLISGHSDVAIGSRLAPGARVVRGPKRELISRCYNLLLRATLRTRFSDAQCGFKAVRADVAHRLLPYVEDTAWFFDTELLVLAERSGLRIHEVPVDWVDDPDSRVAIVPTALADLRGIARVARGLLTRRLPVRVLRAELARPPLPGRPRGADDGAVLVPSPSITGDRPMTTVPAADSGDRPDPADADPAAAAVQAVPAVPAIPSQPHGDGRAAAEPAVEMPAPTASGVLAPGEPVLAAGATTTPPPPGPGPAGWRSWPGRLVRGRPGDPSWVQPALLVLLAATAALYLWDLGASGYGNTFYAAAVQAGTLSWKAMFFGSLDSSNYITVDKPPASLWLMALSGRIFGFSSWSMLVPDALCGVASVGVLFAAVRRVAGPRAGLLAGLLCALTPVAALMFRFNNPDALLVLTMVVGGYCVTRAVERGSWRWILLAGVAVGFGFLTKMLQAFLVLPAFALVYLIAAPPAFLRRVGHVLLGGVGVVVGAGWWVATVELWPSGSRPFVGGSQNDSELGLAFGYNGFGRIFGGDGNRGGAPRGGAATSALRDALTRRAATGDLPGFPGGNGAPGRGGGGFGGFGGSAGIGRLFSQNFGAQISWLLPAALILLVGGLWATRRAARTDLARAGLVLWGGWLVGSGLVFSYMKGTIHEYYSIALAPSVGATVAIGALVLWRDREDLISRLFLAASFGVSGWWAYRLLGRIDWESWLRVPVLVAGVLAALLTLVAAGRPAAATVEVPDPADGSSPVLHGSASPPARRGSLPVLDRFATRGRTSAATVGIAALAGVGLLAGPTAYALDTAGTAHTGATPLAGPGNRGGGAPFAIGARAGGAAGGTGRDENRFGGQGFGGQGFGQGGLPGGFGGQAPGGGALPGGGANQGGGTNQGRGLIPGGGSADGSNPGGDRLGGGTRQNGGPFGGGFGGPDGGSSNAAVTTLLTEGAAGYRWVAAVANSQSAATLELSTGGKPVMAIGGFSGGDPAITLAEFQRDVATRKIHYFLGGGGFGGGLRGGGGSDSEISSWVQKNFTSVTIGGQTLYDLTKPTKPGAAA
ncbi:glycosyltransferase family 39 protein [Pseudofrankia inefficax]|uniref:glycosyltransferase family 39 protein n=1 Tax=Pseudofrankia inefficax (strain DSM 45817 / CECT 9037 / DDB 130130 / EuI1c) TaxID=298654 RepID=UPI00032151B8